MKTTLLILVPLAFGQSTETPATYERGKVTVFARAISARPFLNQAEVSIVLTHEQRLEIRMLQAEIKAARAELRALEARLALLIHDAKDEVRAPKDWLFDSETMRFVKPKPQEKP